ncbi:Hypothetical predicted protein, partial [Marmota monax]
PKGQNEVQRQEIANSLLPPEIQSPESLQVIHEAAPPPGYLQRARDWVTEEPAGLSAEKAALSTQSGTILPPRPPASPLFLATGDEQRFLRPRQQTAG